MQADDLERLKTDLDAILSVVKKVPADLQETAFRLLLQRWLDDLGSAPRPAATPGLTTPPVPPGGDFPQGFQAFMRANALTNETVAKVFHPLGPGAQLVISDLPGKGKAGQQINLALLLAVGGALEDGVFNCSLEELRNLCLHYNCYDGSNFAANLRNSKDLFKNFRKGEDLELTGAGLKRAAELVKAVAAGASS
jgi:hypothetical protein